VIDTVMLDFTVTDRSPHQSQGIATELGCQYVQLVSNLETPDGSARSPVKATVLRAPDVPGSPSCPRPLEAFCSEALPAYCSGLA